MTAFYLALVAIEAAGRLSALWWIGNVVLAILVTLIVAHGVLLVLG